MCRSHSGSSSISVWSDSRVVMVEVSCASRLCGSVSVGAAARENALYNDDLLVKVAHDSHAPAADTEAKLRRPTMQAL